MRSPGSGPPSRYPHAEADQDERDDREKRPVADERHDVRRRRDEIRKRAHTSSIAPTTATGFEMLAANPGAKWRIRMPSASGPMIVINTSIAIGFGLMPSCR